MTTLVPSSSVVSKMSFLLALVLASSLPVVVVSEDPNPDNNNNNSNNAFGSSATTTASSPLQAEGIDAFALLENPTNCTLLSIDSENEIRLSTNIEIGVMCLIVPPTPVSTSSSNSSGSLSSSSLFELTIAPNILGRYDFMHKPSPLLWDDDLVEEEDRPDAMGYTWTAPSEGLIYCVASNTTLVFTDFVEGALLSIQVQEVGLDETCTSDIIGYDGYTPVDVAPDEEEEIGVEQQHQYEYDEDGASTSSQFSSGVVWSSHRYFLRADSFSYRVQGEDQVITMANARNVEIGGDPGNDSYMTIEIVWFLDGKEKRFNGYFESNGTTWNMFEARIYDETQEWVTFSETKEQVHGIRDDCFERDEVILSTDNNRAQLGFSNLKLATFLPWSDGDVMEACMAPTSIPQEHSEEADDGASSWQDGAVIWSTSRYILQASLFEFTIAGQDTETMAGSRNIMINGDPGWDEYMTIEIEWLSGIDSSQQRFFAYFNANTTHWNMFEARVRDRQTDRWESFEDLTGVVSGERGLCFTQESLVITNTRGSEIRFKDLVLAVFLPWKDDDAQQGEGQPEFDESSPPPAVLEARSSFALNTEAYCAALLQGQPIITEGSSWSNQNLNSGASSGGGDDDAIAVDETTDGADFTAPNGTEADDTVLATPPKAFSSAEADHVKTRHVASIIIIATVFMVM